VERDDRLAAFASWVEEALAELRADLPPPPPAVAPPAPPVEMERSPAPVPVAPVAPRAVRHRRSVARAVVAVLGTVVALAALAVSVGPAVLPYRTYHVRSGSMEPAIATGSLVVLTKADAEDVDVGDTITFDRPDGVSGTVTHRVVAIRDGAFVTKGDANASPDPWLVPATGTQWRHRFDVPFLGYVFGWLAGTWARVALVVLAVAGLVRLRAR